MVIHNKITYCPGTIDSAATISAAASSTTRFSSSCLCNVKYHVPRRQKRRDMRTDKNVARTCPYLSSHRQLVTLAIKSGERVLLGKLSGQPALSAGSSAHKPPRTLYLLQQDINVATNQLRYCFAFQSLDRVNTVGVIAKVLPAAKEIQAHYHWALTVCSPATRQHTQLRLKRDRAGTKQSRYYLCCQQ